MSSEIERLENFNKNQRKIIEGLRRQLEQIQDLVNMLKKVSDHYEYT